MTLPSIEQLNSNVKLSVDAEEANLFYLFSITIQRAISFQQMKFRFLIWSICNIVQGHRPVVRTFDDMQFVTIDRPRFKKHCSLVPSWGVLGLE